ncbi:MAG: hypothetical protein ACRDSS_02585, partial [Actinocrinis sp.]
DQGHAAAVLEAGGWQVVRARAGDKYPDLWRVASRHTAARPGGPGEITTVAVGADAGNAAGSGAAGLGAAR